MKKTRWKCQSEESGNSLDKRVQDGKSEAGFTLYVPAQNFANRRMKKKRFPIVPTFVISNYKDKPSKRWCLVLLYKIVRVKAILTLAVAGK
jgi:hypothetical protein